MRNQALLLAPALLLFGAARAGGASPQEVGDREEKLGERPELASILELALGRNFELREAGARADQARARAERAGALPDPELRYQLWDLPLTEPMGGMHMLGFSQSFPAPGSRAARAAAGREEARMAELSSRTAAEEVATRVRRAWWDFYRAHRQIRIHLDNRELSQRFVDLARAGYQAGRASQQDVLRAGVELSRIEADLAASGALRDAAQARLNALMGRDPEAPIGEPAEVAPPADAADVEALASGLDAARPELGAAGHAVVRSEKNLEVARREARLPSFMVGAEYGVMPMAGLPGSVGAMVSVSLPWLNPDHRHAVREAEAALAADRHARESARLAARYQLREAASRLTAARRSFTIIEEELLPLARRSFEAAQAGFVAGASGALDVLDAQRSYLALRLDRERALAELLGSQADLERAAGIATAGLSRAEEQ